MSFKIWNTCLPLVNQLLIYLCCTLPSRLPITMCHISPLQWWKVSLLLLSLWTLMIWPKLWPLMTFDTNSVWGKICIVGKITLSTTHWWNFWDNLKHLNFDQLWTILNLHGWSRSFWTSVSIPRSSWTIYPHYHYQVLYF